MKISELGLAGTLSGTEVLPIVQSGTTKKVSIDDVVALAGGGGTNPTSTYIPVNNAGTFADSFLNQSGNVLKSVYAGNATGLKLDFANDRYYFGDFAGINNGIRLEINNTNQWIQTFCDTTGFPNGIILAKNYCDFGCFNNGGNEIKIGLNGTYQKLDFTSNRGIEGLSFNYASYLYQFGEFYGYHNGTSFIIDDDNSFIKTSYSGNDNGLKLDFANNYFNVGDFQNRKGLEILNNANCALGYRISTADNWAKGIQVIELGEYPTILIGDFDLDGGLGNKTQITLSDGQSLIKTSYQGNDNGLKLDFAQNNYKLGDYAGQGFGALFTIDNFASQASIFAPTILFNSSGNCEFVITQNLSSRDGGYNLKGFSFDFASNDYRFGNIDGGLYLETLNSDIARFLSSLTSTICGFNFDNSNALWFYGSETIGKSGMEIDGTNQKIKMYWNGNIQGFDFIYASTEYKFGDIVNGSYYYQNNWQLTFGDIGGLNNSSYFGINDQSETLLASSNLLVGTSGSVSGQHLKINVGGTDYVIELKNP